jgi:hypothetical protein
LSRFRRCSDNGALQVTNVPRGTGALSEGELAMKSVGSWSGILGVISLLLAAILGCAQFSDFDHISQYVSEVYAVGTPYGRELRFFLLVPGGILVTLFGVLAPRQFPKSRLIGLGFLGVAIFYGISTVIGSVFPCDAGCTRDLSEPSSSYLIHLTAGMLTHSLVPPSLLMIGIAALKWRNGKLVVLSSVAVATLCFGCNFHLGADPTSVYAGLLQRIFEGSILCWILIVAFFMQKASHSFDHEIEARVMRSPLTQRRCPA